MLHAPEADAELMTLRVTRAEPAADGIQLFELRHPQGRICRPSRRARICRSACPPGRCATIPFATTRMNGTATSSP
ncbi:hypothetical protein ACFQU7_39195 [Pseudoroseomonas wenyumeiae]